MTFSSAGSPVAVTVLVTVVVGPSTVEVTVVGTETVLVVVITSGYLPASSG
jgi:hypothetical protein